VPNNKRTGDKGEQLASDYLINKEYSILDMNWRNHHLELDIVAQKDNLLVIVEVKTANSREFGLPQEWVTRKKQKHIIQAAHAYIMLHKIQMEARFDIIAILLGPGSLQPPQIEHIEDAFSAIG
jgi:putative endonuclease